MIVHMKRIIFSLFLLMTIQFGFAQEAATPSQNASADTSSSDSSSENPSAEAFAIIPELECEESTDLDGLRTRVTFNANVPNCLVYLNGNLQGRTKLSLINLVDGIYLLRIAKDGYEIRENFITVDSGKAKTYYVELQPTEETQKKLDSQAQKQSAQVSKAEAPAESTAQDTAAEPAQADAAATESTSSGAIQ